MQRLYLPILGSEASKVSILDHWVSDALANGPVDTVIAHETEAWKEVASLDWAALNVILLDADRIAKYEDQADKFLAPLIERLKPAQPVSSGGEQPVENVYRAMRVMLVELQIGCQFQAMIAPSKMILNEARNSSRAILGQLPPEKPEEIEFRLSSLYNVLDGYSPEQIPGIGWRHEANETALVEVLDDEFGKALGRSKWALALQNSPLATRKARAAQALQDCLGGKLASRVGMAMDTLSILDVVGTPPLLTAAGLLGKVIGGLNLETFAPSRIDPWSLGSFAQLDVVTTVEYGSQHSFFTSR